MRLLLDTCTLIWLAHEPGRLGAGARAVIDDPDSELLFSHASVWEVYNKCSSGKLRFSVAPRDWVAEQLAVWGVRDLPIDLPSLARMSELPMHHRDPFDRLLVAQALVHQLTLVSPDGALPPYGVRLLW